MSDCSLSTLTRKTYWARYIVHDVIRVWDTRVHHLVVRVILAMPFEVIISHMRTDELPTLLEAQGLRQVA